MLFGARTNAGDVVKLPLIMWLRKETTWTVLPRPISSGNGKEKKIPLLSLHDINKQRTVKHIGYAKKTATILSRLPRHACDNSKVSPYISEEYC